MAKEKIAAIDIVCPLCCASVGEACRQIRASVLPGGIKAGELRRLPHYHREDAARAMRMQAAAAKLPNAPADVQAAFAKAIRRG